ncbi:hypothetical protein [Nevskia ramosa]|uniref:hypothetical protein n=1 Tax=Nevskia ramosa TaxID=64002 RepID=UPI002357FB0B|nr:hypothetical protein [Nevskia ramosa]
MNGDQGVSTAPGPVIDVPIAVLDLLRFMCETWAKTDEWARTNGNLDAIGSYPVIQGTGNQIRLLRISSQPYDHRNLRPALDWMQQFNASGGRLPSGVPK